MLQKEGKGLASKVEHANPVTNPKFCELFTIARQLPCRLSCNFPTAAAAAAVMSSEHGNQKRVPP